MSGHGPHRLGFRFRWLYDTDESWEFQLGQRIVIRHPPGTYLDAAQQAILSKPVTRIPKPAALPMGVHEGGLSATNMLSARAREAERQASMAAHVSTEMVVDLC